MNPRTARWVIPAFAAAFRGTDASQLEPSTRVLLLLRIAAVEHCPYWRLQWEPAAGQLGVPEEKVVLVGTEDWEQVPAFSPREHAAVTWADRMARRLAQRDRVAFAELGRQFNQIEVAEVTLVAAMAAMAVRFANALRIHPEPPTGFAPESVPLPETELAEWSRHMFDVDMAAAGERGMP